MVTMDLTMVIRTTIDTTVCYDINLSRFYHYPCITMHFRLSIPLWMVSISIILGLLSSILWILLVNRNVFYAEPTTIIFSIKGFHHYGFDRSPKNTYFFILQCLIFFFVHFILKVSKIL